MDLVLSFGHQTLAHRVVVFWKDSVAAHAAAASAAAAAAGDAPPPPPSPPLEGALPLAPLFPPDFADLALEVGPHRNHAGPGLAAFINVRRAPADVADWISAHPLLSRHVQRTIWLPRGPTAPPPAADGDVAALAAAVGLPGMLPDGLTGLRILPSPSRLATAIAACLDPGIPLDPRSASHVLCVARLPAGGDWTAGQHGVWEGQTCSWAGQSRVGRLRAAVANRAAHKAAKRAGGSRDAAAASAATAEAAAAAAAAEAAAAAAAAPEEQPKPTAAPPPPSAVPHELRFGIVPATWCYVMAPYTKPVFEGAPGTAVFKLDEALRMLAGDGDVRRTIVGPRRLCGNDSSRRDCVAAPFVIDVGASPGAWAQHLAAGHGCAVAAVDPGALDAAVAALPGVHHVRALSQDAGPAVAALIAAHHRDYGCCGGDAGGGSEGNGNGGSGGGPQPPPPQPPPLADMLVSDINMHPFEAIGAVRPLLALVRPGGRVVLTLKLPGSGRDRAPLVARVAELLGGDVDPRSVRCVWLLANTSCERTLFATKAAAAADR